MGLTVGLGCLLVAAGTPSKRLVTPNARFLVGRAGMDDGMHGQTAEILVQVKDVMKDNQRGIAALARLCKVDQDRMVKDTQRDFYLTAPEAVQYGLVDAVLIPPQPIKIMRNREADNDVINFGHFSEARQVRGGPASRGYTEPVKPKDPDEEAREALRNKQSEREASKGRPRDPRFMPPGWGDAPPTTAGGGNGNNNNKNRWKGL